MRSISLYQIYDNVAKTVVGPIITAHHDAAAVRIFTDLLKDPKTRVGTHPKDYDLLELGVQDEANGAILGYDKVKTLLAGATWAAMQQPRAEDSPDEAQLSAAW